MGSALLDLDVFKHSGDLWLDLHHLAAITTTSSYGRLGSRLLLLVLNLVVALSANNRAPCDWTVFVAAYARVILDFLRFLRVFEGLKGHWQQNCLLVLLSIMLFLNQLTMLRVFFSNLTLDQQATFTVIFWQSHGLWRSHRFTLLHKLLKSHILLVLVIFACWCEAKLRVVWVYFQDLDLCNTLSTTLWLRHW